MAIDDAKQCEYLATRLALLLEWMRSNARLDAIGLHCLTLRGIASNEAVNPLGRQLESLGQARGIGSETAIDRVEQRIYSIYVAGRQRERQERRNKRRAAKGLKPKPEADRPAPVNHPLKPEFSAPLHRCTELWLVELSIFLRGLLDAAVDLYDKADAIDDEIAKRYGQNPEFVGVGETASKSWHGMAARSGRVLHDRLLIVLGQPTGDVPLVGADGEIIETLSDCYTPGELSLCLPALKDRLAHEPALPSESVQQWGRRLEHERNLPVVDVADGNSVEIFPDGIEGIPDDFMLFALAVRENTKAAKPLTWPKLAKRFIADGKSDRVSAKSFVTEFRKYVTGHKAKRINVPPNPAKRGN